MQEYTRKKVQEAENYTPKRSKVCSYREKSLTQQYQPQLFLGYGTNCPLNSGVLHLSTSSGRS